MLNSVPGVFHSAVQTLVLVLLFAPSEAPILVIYFKLWLAIVLCGALHGLVLLPSMLGLCGPLPKDSNFEEPEPKIAEDYEPVSKHEFNTRV